MAEEPTDAAADEEKGSGGGLIFKIAIAAVVLIIPAVAVFITYQVAIKPVLAKNEPAPIASNPDAPDPTQIVNYEFEQAFTDLTPTNPEYPAATLAYQIGFECLNPATEQIILQHEARFAAVITDKHRHHTREEANEHLLQKSIEQQILMEANALLDRYNPTPDLPVKVLDVYHVTWFIRD